MFVLNNSYYKFPTYEWNMPTGWTCPCAKECLVTVDRRTGQQTNKSNEFKCYSAAAERFPAVRERRWRNLEFIKRGGTPKVPNKAKLIRIHASGDFFSQKYFDTWIGISYRNPTRLFWAYTKSLSFWVNRINQIPRNFVLIASYGGKQDNLIKEHNLKHCKVIKSIREAGNLLIDYNDELAKRHKLNFCLLENTCNGEGLTTLDIIKHNNARIKNGNNSSYHK